MSFDDRDDESAYKKIKPYILVSLLIHLLLFLLFEKIPGFVTAEVTQKEAPIWVDLKPQRKYEIADIDKPAEEKRPDQSKFLGMYDSSVPEEQVAARQGKNKQLSEPTKPGARPKAEKEQKQKEPMLKDLYKFDKDMFTAPEKKDNTARNGPKTLADGTPAQALPDDYYPDYKKGDRTYLNVLRYPDIQYFVILKRVFKMTFDPVPPLREAFNNNQVTRGTIETVLGVTLDAKGNLAELFIFKSSGISEYDQEALRTIRASSPFSSPPEKLLDKEGLIRMSWTFTVYL